MILAKTNNPKERYIKKEKILLMLMPYWTPLIPPMGISCLKSFLQKYEYDIKTIDVNIIDEFREIYKQYFDILEKNIDGSKRGNLYNIGHDVLQNHMMAHINNSNEEEYITLVKVLIYKNFYCNFKKNTIEDLNGIISNFYHRLERYILDLLAKEKPTTLGISVFRGTLPASLFTFKLVKEKNINIRTVMGGGIFSQEIVLGTPEFDFFLEKTPYIDNIIIGEGEILFHKLLRGELDESKKVYTMKDIKNEVLDILSVDIPDFSDFHLHYYPNLAAYSSRSCPFQCNFCAETVNWGKFRKKNAKFVVEELVKLYKKYGSQLFLMCDSLLNPIITELAKEFIKTDFSLYWDCYLRADKAVGNIKNTTLWRRGGLYRARLGLESGSQYVLDLIKKGVTIDQIKAAISALASVGVKTSTMWIIGYPGETEEAFQMTLDLMEELKNDIYEAECNHFRYFLSGQVNSDEWLNKSKQLYPAKAKNMLITQTWILEDEPCREVVFKRINRFVEHCSELGIPNPYSMNEIYQAEERWKKLHKNAVPSLIDLKDKDMNIDECKNIGNLFYAEDLYRVDGDWGF